MHNVDDAVPSSDLAAGADGATDEALQAELFSVLRLLYVLADTHDYKLAPPYARHLSPLAQSFDILGDKHEPMLARYRVSVERIQT